jgi:hypothetical protein
MVLQPAVGLAHSTPAQVQLCSRDMSFHEQTMPSGKPIRITMCSLASGGEHNDRYPDEDCFTIEYVMSSPEVAQEAKDREAMEVFELIRPISEEWKIAKAEVIAFPTLKRKGIYYVYSLKLTPAGKWDYRRDSAKVHSND